MMPDKQNSLKSWDKMEFRVEVLPFDKNIGGILSSGNRVILYEYE